MTTPPEGIACRSDTAAHQTSAALCSVLAVVGGRHAQQAQHGAADPTDLTDPVTRERGEAAAVIGQAVQVRVTASRTALPTIRWGDPKRKILAAARDLRINTCVMGASAVVGFLSLVLGSVSRTASMAAPCSVLVVKHRGGAGARRAS